ncbi:sulfatase-like hydrolase/transferase [Azonexus caeni]|uniref:sulfatase-like hydrolase/transferase n=1 Tax=Azonexus caeni TaxID=266126 RepID=UPI003A85E002
MSALEVAGVLRRYFALLYVALFCMVALFWPQVTIRGGAAWGFTLAASAAYAGLYLAVAALPCLLLALLPRRFAFRQPLLAGAAVVGGSLMLLAMYADYRLYALYQYHFNGFVWNLLTTPGGVAALGATASTELTVAIQVSAIVLANLAVMWGLHRYRQLGWQFPARPAVIAGFVLCGLLATEEVVFAYSVHTGQEELLAAADAIPFHMRTSSKTLFQKLGVERRALQSLRLAGGDVVYPGTAIDSSHLKPTNVIVLVAESFRWDLLDPEITPNLWKFSQRATRYDNHYSGGNRTRMGLFSLFYGVYAPYWYSFEKQRTAPVLMNVLREHNYQIAAHTSQSFDYPELRHTVFSGVPEANLQEIKTGEPWQRDIRNIDDLSSKIDHRDPRRPFFGFMFFESTHAPYNFPEDQALRSDYLRDMNYIDLDLRNNIGGIHNRYINAAHHIDAQVGRLLEHLEKTGMLEQTVLLFTGDHGEEFMEKGRWGHGHGNSFPEEQIRVPLVLWRPGVAPAVVTHRTSHLQVAPTLLAALGVDQPARSYSSAEPLDRELPYFVFGEYNYMGIDDGRNKITFPFTGSDYFRYSVFDENDNPVDRGARDGIVAAASPLLDEVTKESRRFVR